MTVTEGSRTTPADHEAAGTATPELLVPEARQRAWRRRRWITFGTLLVLALATITLFGLPGPPPQPSPATGGQAAEAPFITGQEQRATIVAQYDQYHVGWVLVYDDGRVVGRNEKSTGLSQPVQRRLTAEGLIQVRSGAIHPGALFFLPTPEHEKAWAEPEFSTYVPTAYAGCFDTKGIAQAGRVESLAKLRQLQTGREQTYRDVDIFIGKVSPTPGPFDCFEVKAEEMPSMTLALRDAGFRQIGGQVLQEGCVETTPGAPALCFHPVLPHGSWVLWGG